MMANRAIVRGAWVAPANVPLQGVVALEPSTDPAALLDSAVNGISRQARGFLPADALTLSTDPDLRQINVRRLLILLRRLALRHGTAYVFEPHSDAFRRRVQHNFEALLDILLARGAFAATESRFAYQVRVDVAEDPAELGNSGRLVVDLAVAPSLPMRFLTVRLVQSGGSTFAVEVG
jgi:phage tail sheath protein FI